MGIDEARQLDQGFLAALRANPLAMRKPAAERQEVFRSIRSQFETDEEAWVGVDVLEDQAARLVNGGVVWNILSESGISRRLLPDFMEAQEPSGEATP